MHPARRRLSVLALTVLVLCPHAPAAPAQAAAAAPGFDSSSQVYRCASGVKLPVVYLNIAGGDSFATAYVNGTLVLMRSGPTGSGANYLPVDDRLGYRWQVKGDLGNLWFRAAQPGSRETMLLQNCQALPSP